MKSPLSTVVLILACNTALRADTDVQTITPKIAMEQGWTVEVQEYEEYVSFKVQPPQELVTESAKAIFDVRDGNELISHGVLGVVKFKGSKQYWVSVSKRYLQGSSFTLTGKAVPPSSKSYQMDLRQFVSQKAEKPKPEK